MGSARAQPGPLDGQDQDAGVPHPPVVLYNIRQVARYLGDVSEDHVYRLIAAGALRARDGSVPGSRRSKTRVRSDDLVAYINGTPHVGTAARSA